MNSLELEELARLWRGEEDAREQRIFRRLVWRVGIKAKALRFADYGLAVLIVVAALLGVSWAANAATLVFGVLLGVAAVWATWKRRVLHQSALIGDFNDRESLLSAARDRCALELRQSRWGLLLFPLGILLGATMWLSALTNAPVTRFPAELVTSLPRAETILLALLFVLGEAYFLYRGHRLRRELASIDALREEYHEEAERDRTDPPADAP